jgi:hypothetical protein
MKGRLKAKLAILALWMLPAAPAQAHVRLVPQLGTGYLNSVVVSPDGRFVLTGGDGVRLWDAATARQLQTFPEAAASVAFSPDSRLILTGGGDVPDMSENSVRIWDLASGKLIRSFSGLTSEVTTVAFSSDARSVFAGSRDGTASIWDVATGSKTGALDETSKNHGLGFGQENSPAQYQIPIENTHAAFSPDGRWVLNLANKPKFYAILIGTAKYGDHKLDLVYPAHDAESIATGLEIGAGKLFGPENVHLHLLTTDAEDLASLPTKQNIVAAFEDVKKNAKSSDLLLVYLSGHGVNLRSEKDSYYYLTTDARSLELENNPALRQLSTVSGAELRNWLGAKGMPLKEVLIIDTCAAGAANEELSSWSKNATSRPTSAAPSSSSKTPPAPSSSWAQPPTNQLRGHQIRPGPAHLRAAPGHEGPLH